MRGRWRRSGRPPAPTPSRATNRTGAHPPARARPPPDQPELGGPRQHATVDLPPLRHEGGIGQATHLADLHPETQLVEPSDQVRTGVVPVTDPVHHGRHLADDPVDGQGQDGTALEGRGRGRPDQRQLEGADRCADGAALPPGELLHPGDVVDHGRVVDHLRGHPVEHPGRGGSHLGPDPAHPSGAGGHRLAADVPEGLFQLLRGTAGEPVGCEEGPHPAGEGRTRPGQAASAGRRRTGRGRSSSWRVS